MNASLMIRRCLLLAAALAGLAAASPALGRPHSHATGAEPSVAQPPTATYLFVELWVEVHGSGTLPGYVAGSPGYQFNPPAGTLRPSAGSIPPLYPSDWGFAGAGTSRSGAAGSGADSALLVIPTIPYSTTLPIGTGAAGPKYEHTRDGLVELRGVSKDGTLDAVIDGQHVSLVPGAIWQKTVGADLKAGGYNGHYDVTSSVTNYGWQVRSLVSGPTEFVWLPTAAR
ncbi:MAG TPA: hypothetical protein PLO33_12010 [Kouleothrix sp.]|nr:hypothetical protein [Kouleothrix sp.]